MRREQAGKARKVLKACRVLKASRGATDKLGHPAHKDSKVIPACRVHRGSRVTPLLAHRDTRVTRARLGLGIKGHRDTRVNPAG